MGAMPVSSSRRGLAGGLRAVAVVLVAALAVCGQVLPARAVVPAGLTVPATANLFGAGHQGFVAQPPGFNPGTFPPSMAIPAGASILSLAGVTGLVDCGGPCGNIGPDGGPLEVNIASSSGISGVIDSTPGKAAMALMAVFLNDSEPADPAPARLNFTNNHNFGDLYPLLRQMFYVGDGVTDSGTVQSFHVPAGATRVFFGIADGALFLTGPRDYGDNTGSFSLGAGFGSVAFQRAGVAVVSSGSPTLVGDPVTFTATVSRVTGSGVPSGSVSFADDSGPLGTVGLDANGQAAVTTSTLAFGSRAVSATYSGDSVFFGATATVTQVVGLRPNEVGLRSSRNPATVGDAVTFTAGVGRLGGAAVPTGTIVFRDGTTTLGTATLDGAATASITTSGLARGNHPVTAAYSGDTVYSTNRSGVLDQAVNAAGAVATATALTVDLTEQTATLPLVFTATVAKAGGAAVTGTVEFREAEITIGTGTVDGSGHAVLTTSALPTGAHTVTAAYQGDGPSASSVSGPVTATVVAVPTTTVVVSSLNPANATDNVLLTATVSHTTGAGTPAGTITFTDGAVTLAEVAVDSAGQAVYQSSTLAAGTHPVQARFNGDPYFSASTSAVLSQVVTGLPSVTVLRSSVNPNARTDAITLVATVTAGGAGPVPAGRVVFEETGDVIAEATLDVTGKAVATVGGASVGRHDLLARYVGSPIFTPSSSAVLSQWVIDSAMFGGNNPGTTAIYCPIGDPVNCATGNFFLPVTDLSVPGRGPGLEVSRTYNAQEAATGIVAGRFGPGWSDSYSARLVTNPETSSVTVHHANGSTVTFTPGPAGSFQGGPDVISTLVRNPDGTLRYTYPAQNADEFDATGRLVAQVDPNGYRSTLSYTAGRLAHVNDAAGRQLTYSYTDGKLSGVQDPIGRAVTYGYNPAGDLVTVTDVAGGTTTYGYDSRHRLTTITDPRGALTTNTYDSADRVSGQDQPEARAITFVYNGPTTTITDPRGVVTAQTFNPAGGLTTLTPAVGTPHAATWAFAYDGYGNRSSVTDPNGHTSTATWDNRGNQLTSTDPLGRTTTRTYTAGNDPATVSDPSGVTTTYTYDPAGNPTSISRPLVGTGQAATLTMMYDPARPGDLTEMHDPNGKTWRSEYNPAGDLVAAIDPTGARTTYEYNAIGWRTATTTAKGNSPGYNPAAFRTSYQHTAFGDVRVVTDPAGHQTTTGYDPTRNRTSVTDRNVHTTTWAYDLAGRMTLETRADGSTRATGYDRGGNTTTQTDGLDHTTTYTYDPLGHLTATTDPLGRASTASWDGPGNLRTATGPDNQTTTYSYDTADQLTGIAYSDGSTPNVAYTYDRLGQRATMVDGTGTTGYQRDSLGRLTAVTRGTTTAYGYDLAGRQTSITYPTAAIDLIVVGLPVHVGHGTVTRGYDDAGRITSITDFVGRTTRYHYDPDGNTTSIDYGNGATSTSTYDTLGRVTRTLDTSPTGTTIVDQPYTYDPEGQLATGALTPAGTGTQAYHYDPNQRLTATGAVTPAAQLPLQAYGYDAADNLTRITVGPVAFDLGHDNANQLTTMANTATGAVATYTHDPRGRRTATTDTLGNSATYTWDQAGRLTDTTGPALNTLATTTGTPPAAVHHDYDGDGLLAEVDWDRSGPLPVPIGDTLGRYAVINGPDGLPLQRLDVTGGGAPTTTWYHHDRQGSTRALTDDGGLTLTTTTYDPYGNTLTTTATSGAASITNPYGYTGQYTDPTTGLIYLRARWYDPTTGHLLTRDALETLTRQAYLYGGGDPVNRVDQTGLCATTLSGDSPRPSVAATLACLANNLFNDAYLGLLSGAAALGHSAVAALVYSIKLGAPLALSVGLTLPFLVVAIVLIVVGFTLVLDECFGPEPGT